MTEFSAPNCQLQSPSIEVEYLANYLAELTLIDFGFLNFAPSIVAASALFLARWTLDQSCHPWVSILFISPSFGSIVYF